MTLLVVALKDEARPLIESFKLSHIPEIKEYKVYKRDDLALIVSIKNKTVVTAIDRDNLKDNLFTKIDSAIIIDSEKENNP